MNNTLEVGKRLVALCNQGNNLQAIEELYGPNVVSVEARAEAGFPQRMEGLEAIRGKNQWWMDNHTVFAGKAVGPFPHGERFVVVFDYEVEPKVGPMKGRRMQMQEAALYTVRDGKIVQEEFFYDM